MLARILIATATIPGGGTLRLVRRGDDHVIMLGANELMSSRQSGSEQALAQRAIAAIETTARPRVLIGGLGMGFTLRAAIDAAPAGAALHVAELVPAVVDWARGPLAGLFGSSLDDPRTHVRIGDVAALIGPPEPPWDAILLDVDNGPHGLTHPANDRLYSAAGLAAAHRALRPGGVLAIWSSAADAAFTRRLRSAGFAVSEERVRAVGTGKGARHTIWLATRLHR